MPSIAQKDSSRPVLFVARACSTFAICGGVLTLIGWFGGLPRLTSWTGNGICMFVNTAIMAVCTGTALFLHTLAGTVARNIGRVLAAIVLLIGGATLFQHISGANLGIDTLLVREPWGARAATAPGRPGPTSSTAFTLLAIALFLTGGGRRARMTVPILGIAVASLSSLSLIGYMFGAPELFAIAGATGIAMQTGTMVFALAIGMITIIPEQQPMRTLCENSGTGLLARRALPFIIALPVVFGYLRVRGQDVGLYDYQMGTALTVLALIAALCVLLWWCLGAVHQRERVLKLKEKSLLQEISDRQHTQQALAKRVHEQAALYQFTDRLHRAESLSSVVEAALDGIHHALGCHRASILLFDDTGVMRFVGWRGLSDDYRSAVEGHSPWGPEEKDAQPICIKDIMVTDLSDDLKAVIAGEGIRSLAFIPLFVHGRLAGKFMAYYDTPHSFTRAEVDFAVTIARQLSFGVERKRAEEQLRRAVETAEAASRAKDDFLAALSHELRTPLTPALLSVASLAEDPSLPADVREQLAMVSRNIQMEARLIDDLLDLTRVSHGKLKIEPVPTDLHELIEHARQTVAEDVADKGVVFRLDLDAQQHHVLGDPARLRQVFWNLLKNAVKFTPRGGSIVLRSQNPTPGRVVCSVQDSGIGIAPEALPRIFLAFDQGGLEGRHEFGGLGLGLSISKALVDLHGGQLTAFSDGRGCGATFTVELETTIPAAASEAPGLRDPHRTLPLRLLVVDDHEPTLAAVSRLLQREGHAVFCASSVSEALTQAAQNSCDMVISDVGLPDGTGFELMSEIRRRHGWPGIALTGYGMEHDLRNSAASGFSVHLVKPIDLSQLRDAIELTLARSKVNENGTALAG